MARDRSTDLQDHHNDGQKDGADGKYHPPHTITPLDELIHRQGFLDEMREDNAAYRTGYDNGRKSR
jgi:hypothetical protein